MALIDLVFILKLASKQIGFCSSVKSKFCSVIAKCGAANIYWLRLGFSNSNLSSHTCDFSSPISQVPKLFGIYHLLDFIRDSLGYNLYLVEYLQKVPFYHNIDRPIPRHSESFFVEVFEISKELPQ